MSEFIVEEQEKRRILNTEELEEKFSMRVLVALEFGAPWIEKVVKKRCQKVFRRNELTLDEKWLGSFFEEEILAPPNLPLVIKLLDASVGYGVFADKDLAKKTYIGEYTGTVRQVFIKHWKSTDYWFVYPLEEICRVYYAIDASKQGNITRFVNHSDEPNCEMTSVFAHGAYHIVLYTKRPIKAGEQLTYDYGPDYWKKRAHKKKQL